MFGPSFWWRAGRDDRRKLFSFCSRNPEDICGRSIFSVGPLCGGPVRSAPKRRRNCPCWRCTGRICAASSQQCGTINEFDIRLCPCSGIHKRGTFFRHRCSDDFVVPFYFHRVKKLRRPSGWKAEQGLKEIPGKQSLGRHLKPRCCQPLFNDGIILKRISALESFF